jgi:hypothetical protein
MKHITPKTGKAVRITADPGSVQPELNAHAEVAATRKIEPLVALRPVRVTLELIDASHTGATAVAHSGLDQEDGARLIRVGLCGTHILVNRALHRADTFAIRFLIGIALVEYSLFWWHSSDGKGVTDALRQAAGYAPDQNAWGSGFASRLASSDFLRPVDQLPIFGASPKAGPHQIGEFKAVLRHPSDILRWRSSNASPEGERIPTKKPKPSHGVVPPGPLTTSGAAPSPAPSFAETFLQCARETLDTATLAALTDLTRERLST